MANIFKNSRIFMRETYIQLRKAVWPTWSEVRDATVVVLVASIMLAFAIFLADISVYNWVTALTKAVR